METAAVELQEKIYKDALNITDEQFISEGHIKGFMDAIHLPGIYDEELIKERVSQFILHSKSGNDVNSFPFVAPIDEGSEGAGDSGYSYLYPDM